MIGVALLVLALSLHALFEGLSLAVISDASKLLEVMSVLNLSSSKWSPDSVFQVFAALILHKCIIGFSLGVRLVESGLKTPWVALCSCLFSIQVSFAHMLFCMLVICRRLFWKVNFIVEWFYDRLGKYVDQRLSSNAKCM